MSWGPLIFGHADSQTVEAVIEAARDGTTYGTATEREVELAEEIVGAVPSVEMVRLVSSGTEAAMTALRLARAVTEREPLVRFAGGYHGHADPFLSEAGSGVRTRGIEAAAEGRVVPYNDLEAVEGSIEGAACVFGEPARDRGGAVRAQTSHRGGLRAARAEGTAARRARAIRPLRASRCDRDAVRRRLPRALPSLARARDLPGAFAERGDVPLDRAR